MKHNIIIIQCFLVHTRAVRRDDHIKTYIAMRRARHEILEAIETDPNHEQSVRFILRYQKGLRRKFLNGMTPLQAPLAEMEKKKKKKKSPHGVFEVLNDKRPGSLINAFVVHHSSLSHLKKHTYVVFLDCTCKTNRPPFGHVMVILNILSYPSN